MGQNLEAPTKIILDNLFNICNTLVMVKTLNGTIKEIGWSRYILTISGDGSSFTKESTFGAISAAKEWARNYAQSLGMTITFTVIFLDSE